MIELHNVEKAFETRAGKTFVLRRIDLTISEGEFVTIMGPSGAGKTTLLSILGMLDHAWTGRVPLPRPGRARAQAAATGSSSTRRTSASSSSSTTCSTT